MFFNDYIIECIVLKPRPARRVDPGPGHGTGPDLSKNPPGSWPGETRPTRVTLAKTRPIFFYMHRGQTTKMNDALMQKRPTSLHVFVIFPFILASTRANRLQPSISFDTSGFSLLLPMTSS
jgi:hypothetical protein